jgi:uncharacterized protein YcbK (DUF882 family)
MTLIDEKLLVNFEYLRKSIDIPMLITSGYRCPLHNSCQKKSSRVSRHMMGRAIDFLYTDLIKFKYSEKELIELIKYSGFCYTYFNKEENFFHMEIRK